MADGIPVMQTEPQNDAKKQLKWCSLLHVANDGYIASITVLLPFIAADLGLNYTQSGLLKTASASAIAAAQIPAGLLSERIGEVLTLGVGMAWFSLSYIVLTLAISYGFTLVWIFSAGVGGGAYHPVGTALVSNVYPPEKSGPAIGTLNFFGDVGKVVFPALIGILVIRIGWQESFGVLGGIGMSISLLYLFFFRRTIGRKRQRPTLVDDTPGKNVMHRGSIQKIMANWGIRRPGQFTLYTIIGFLDVAVRSGVMAFLGFMLIENGIREDAVGGFLALTFFGGAFGKLLCGMPIRKLGSKRIVLITEMLMILGCYLLPSISAGWTLALFLPIFGFMLNGTSSVIYIGLAPTFEPERRSRGYALYYTLNFFSTAVSPYFLGLVGDAYNLDIIFYTAGVVMLIGLPLAVFLKDV